MSALFDFSILPRCGAKARSNDGNPCKQPAMTNGRCYLHGGKSPTKHGNRSKVAKAKRSVRRAFINSIRGYNKSLEDLAGG